MPPYSNYSKGLKRKTGAVKTTHAMSLQVFTSNICTQSEIEKQACILQTKWSILNNWKQLNLPGL